MKNKNIFLLAIVFLWNSNSNVFAFSSQETFLGEIFSGQTASIFIENKGGYGIYDAYNFSPKTETPEENTNTETQTETNDNNQNSTETGTNINQNQTPTENTNTPPNDSNTSTPDTNQNSNTDSGTNTGENSNTSTNTNNNSTESSTPTENGNTGTVNESNNNTNTTEQGNYVGGNENNNQTDSAHETKVIENNETPVTKNSANSSRSSNTNNKNTAKEEQEVFISFEAIKSFFTPPSEDQTPQDKTKEIITLSENKIITKKPTKNIIQNIENILFAQQDGTKENIDIQNKNSKIEVEHIYYSEEKKSETENLHASASSQEKNLFLPTAFLFFILGILLFSIKYSKYAFLKNTIIRRCIRYFRK